VKDRLNISLDGHVALVMLNRPEKYNALDLRMFNALGEAAESLASESKVRAVVLYGAGDNFCAGIDIGVLTDPNVKIDESMLAPWRRAANSRRGGPALRGRRYPIFNNGNQVGADSGYGYQRDAAQHSTS
jgi:enoyl-CoA hydratase/carnithine racemase